MTNFREVLFWSIFSVSQVNILSRNFVVKLFPAREKELLGPEVSQAEKDAVLSKCLSSQRNWAARKPKHTLSAISVDVGPIFDPDEAARRLCLNWGGVYSARDTDFPIDHAQKILCFVQPAPRDLNWSVQVDIFQELLASKQESALDPHGLPYSVNRSAGGIGAKFLFVAYQAARQGAPLPQKLWCWPNGFRS